MKFKLIPKYKKFGTKAGKYIKVSENEGIIMESTIAEIGEIERFHADANVVPSFSEKEWQLIKPFYDEINKYELHSLLKQEKVTINRIGYKFIGETAFNNIKINVDGDTLFDVIDKINHEVINILCNKNK